MKWSVVHAIAHLLEGQQRALVVVLSALLVVTPLLTPAQTAHADPICFQTINGQQCITFPPPPLLNLNQSLYGATAAQAASLQKLEDQAVTNIIDAHNLSSGDGDAVRTWARNDAEADLYTLLVEAITTTAASRTSDQQNVVDWLSAVAQRRAVGAAQDAGVEYVKWAGLPLGDYQTLLNGPHTQSDLQSFFSKPGYPLSQGGYCTYRSPAPYASEYTAYQTDPTCNGGSPGLFYTPPTPEYDQFTKWGEADADYALLNTGDYLSASKQIGIASGITVPLAAIDLAVGAIGTVGTQAAITAANLAAVGSLQAPTVASATALEAINAFPAATSALGPAIAVTVVLIAVEAAIIKGIDVANAAQLPGKLATLIHDAETTPPDVAALESSSNGQATLYELFVGATLPVPVNQTCDNSNPPLPPGLTVTNGKVIVTGQPPCLNLTPIPPSSPTDPQFLVQAKGGSTSTKSPTLTWKDAAAGITTTARLSRNWFVENESAQTLSIAYTDWNGKEQNAWLVGGGTHDYLFLTFSAPPDTSTSIDPSTCAGNGSCSWGTSIDYIGSDGLDYSASVQGPPPPPPAAKSTGSPSWSAPAVEGSPVTFNANTFAPDPANGAVTYGWNFELAQQPQPNVTITCITVGGGSSPGPCINYSAPVSGATVTYTWQTSGTYHVSLTATDASGTPVTDTFTVPVGAVPPTASLLPACSSNPFANPTLCNPSTWDLGTTVRLGGGVGHAGSLDLEQVTVKWGDGSAETLYGLGNGSLYFISANAAGPGTPPGDPLTLTPVSSSPTLGWILGDSHTYAKPGVYVVTLTASQLGGPSDSVQFTETIVGTQAITFPAIPTHTYGDAPFLLSASGGGSSQPVTFAVSGDPSVCALSSPSGGTGNVNLKLLEVGTCAITASQAGDAIYHPAAAVTQSFTIQPAGVTVTASSASITYGGTLPAAVTPTYAGFVNGDSAAGLATPPTCVVAPNTGGAGTYATTCSGASAANYTFSYVPGSLTINKAPLTATANNKSMIYGAIVPMFDATFSGFLNGDTSGVLTGLACGAADNSNSLPGSTAPVGGTTPAGQYPITCSGGTAANYALTYVPGALTITQAASSIALASTPAAPVFGQPVTITATLADATLGSTGHPSGSVEFKDAGTDLPVCTAQPVSTTAGTATCTTSALAVGTHTLTAMYSGDHNFTSSSTASALALTVAKASSTVTLAPTTPVTQGQPVTFTAVVAAAQPGVGNPTGTVTFSDGTTSLGSGQLGVLNNQIRTSFVTGSLAAGAHTITASYAGDGNFQISSSPAVAQYVNTNLSSYPKLPSGAFDLTNANFTGGYFIGVSLVGASATGSNFKDAVFTSADLSGANMSNSNFMGAGSLANAILKNANLSNSNFQGINFAGANLTSANLSGSNLMDATGMRSATLTGVIWSNTLCPDGTNSNTDGGTCIGHL